MASTNKTTNYELSQFEGTDKPSWEADYNADMLSIDTNLKAVSDVADGASGSISSLADRVTTAEGNITTNANDIDALEARADALEAGQTSDDSRLDAIEAEQIVQNTAIESNTRLGYNLARPYDSASTYSVGAYVLFQDTLYKCTTAVTTGESFDPTKWLAIKATDEIAAGGYTLPTASANTLGGVKVGSNLSIDQDGVLSGSAPYSLPIASANILGGVKVGSGLNIDVNGVLSSDASILSFNDPISIAFMSSSQYTGSFSARETHLYIIGSIKILTIRMVCTNVTTTSSTANAMPAFTLTWSSETEQYRPNLPGFQCFGTATCYCYSGITQNYDHCITGTNATALSWSGNRQAASTNIGEIWYNGTFIFS